MCTLTINKSLGLTYESIVIIQPKAILYIDAEVDATGRFVRLANKVSVTDIVERNAIS